MNTVLWILQLVLSLKLLSVVYTHGLRVDQAKMQQGRQRIGGAARPLLIFVALCACVGGLGLVLPAAAGVLTWLTPWSAALVAVMMVLAIGFHVTCRGLRHIVPGLVLLALAVFVCYGRWVMAPF